MMGLYQLANDKNTWINRYTYFRNLCVTMWILVPKSKYCHIVSLLEKAMAPHSSTLAWQIPWTEEPGRLQSKGSLRVGHDWATSLSLSTFMHWRRRWQPTPVFLPGESQGGGALWAAIYGFARSRTRLKWLSSSSSSFTFKLKRKLSHLHLSTTSKDEFFFFLTASSNSLFHTPIYMYTALST